MQIFERGRLLYSGFQYKFKIKINMGRVSKHYYINGRFKCRRKFYWALNLKSIRNYTSTNYKQHNKQLFFWEQHHNNNLKAWFGNQTMLFKLSPTRRH